MSEDRQPLRVDFAGVRARVGEAVWHDLPFGVSLKLRGMLGLTAAAIEGQISADLSAFAAGEDVVTRYGYDPVDVGLLADRSIANGWARMHMACVRGAALIEDWNLVDGDEAPLEISEANIQQLFNVGPFPGAGSALMAAFNRLVDAPRQRVEAEKKGSAASLTGASEAAQSTAPDAGPLAPPAPPEGAKEASSAPKSSTRRTRRKGS